MHVLIFFLFLVFPPIYGRSSILVVCDSLQVLFYLFLLSHYMDSHVKQLSIAFVQVIEQDPVSTKERSVM